MARPRPLTSERSRATALWLWGVAALVAVMILVGGLTRLTDSGLSITEWRPVSGAVPPLSLADWEAEFARYRQTHEYQAQNAGMTLEQFRWIYGWEWAHRFLGRLIGVAYAAGFILLRVTRRAPRRLLPAMTVLFGLGALQGAVGWWMVTSGLSDRLDVAPERLMVHLGLALVLFAGLVWTGLEAWFGPRRAPVRSGWTAAAGGLLALVYVQLLLGALVAGNDAGLVHGDWPLFSGRWWPSDYTGDDLRATVLHSRAAVQAHHRLAAYALLAAAVGLAVAAFRRASGRPLRLPAAVIAGLVSVQAALGVATLWLGVPLALGALHQTGAVAILLASLLLLWRARVG